MSKTKILVVEDEVVIAMEIENSLQNLGYEVTSVSSSSDDAIQKIEIDKPDLILMDIRIKGDKDGIETAELVKEKYGIPVIFSTAYLDEERIERAKITMPFGYVLKPIQERDLKVTLEMALYVSKIDEKRRKAEDDTKAQLAFLDSIMEQSPFAMWISDTSGVVIKTNHKLRTTLNLEDDQIVGKYNVLEDANLVEQGVMPKVKAVFTQKIPVNFTIWWEGNSVGDVEYSGANNLWISVSIFPIFNHRKEFISVGGQWIDITSQKKAEEALRNNEQLLSEVINSMEKAIAIYEPVNEGEDFRFVDTNEFAEKIMHLKTEDVIGKTIKELFPGESSLGLIEKLNESYSSGKSTTIPLKQYKDDRITQWVENYIFKLPSGKVVAMFEDTYEKRKQNQDE